MTPERWKRVAELFEAALEMEDSTAFLAGACADDTDLRAEVDSLLEEHARAGDFLNRPASAEAASALQRVWRDGPLSTEDDPYLGMTLMTRYRIEAKLARGGQALVYRASDLAVMARPVVVKILIQAAEENDWLRKKFEQELEALSRIDHPGVAGVLDTGALPDGTPFLVIQYVEGVTLRQALENGPLDPNRAAIILRQIGAALEAAHGAGVAHRDLKPENIMLHRLSDGTEQVKLIDFGIARVDQSTLGRVTSTAMVAGTVRYMAPEQFQGENSSASDLYALGIIACEMLSGEAAFEALKAPRKARARIRAALAYRPKDRPARAREFCDRLADSLTRPRAMSMPRRAVVGVGVFAALLMIAYFRPIFSTDDPDPVSVRYLAVLPFDMLGQDPNMEPLELGVADSLITRLSNLSGLIVRPVSAVRRYVAREVDPVMVGRELRVDAVVAGTLQSIEGRIRANVRLIQTRDGEALWAGTIDSQIGHVFTLEDAIAQQVALHVDVRLTESERGSLDSRRRLHPEAHELYLKGRYEWVKRTREGFEEAAKYFQKAIDLDPTYARSYAGLADSYLLLGGYSHSPQLETLPKAKAMAMRALELDPSLGEAHATLGLVSQNLDWDWKEVEHHYRRAIALTPSYATAHHWFAEFLSILGRFDESEREFAQARRIDPISPIIQVDEAQLYFYQRRYDRSLELLRQVAQLDPTFELARERIAFTLLVQGREEEAWEEIQSLDACREESGDCRRAWTAYLFQRDPTAARQALSWLENEAKTRRIPPWVLMLAHARQGEYDRSLDWLEYMLEKHEVWLITLKVNPLFDPLRTQPRFQKVLERLRLDIATAAPPTRDPQANQNHQTRSESPAPRRGHGLES